MTQASMKVLICDDHRLFAEALATALKARGAWVVALAETPVEAGEVAARTGPDVCLMDLHFPSSDGLEGIGLVLAAAPSTKVIMLSGLADQEAVSKAMALGASGAIEKADRFETVLDTIRHVLAGEIIVKEPVLRSAFQNGEPAPSPRRRREDYLTPREREVLEHLARGQDTSTLAKELGVTYATARSHIQNLLEKLGVHSKLEAVAFALTNGLVPVPGGTRDASDRRRARSKPSR